MKTKSIVEQLVEQKVHNLFLELLIAIPEIGKFSIEKQRYIQNQLKIAYFEGEKGIFLF